MQVKVFRDSAGKILAQRGKKPVDSPTDETNAAKLFEEVKAMVRELPERVDQRVREFNPKLRRKSRRFHPAMIDEIVHIAGFREGGATGAAALLAFLSFVREDTTPLYEAGLEFYRSIVSGKEIEIKKNGELVIEVIKLIEHPLFRDISTSEDREYLHYISRALRHLVARILEMHLSRRGKKPLGLDADEDEPKSN